MAVTLVDHRVIWNEGDSITGWSATATLGTTDPVPIESTGWVGYTVGAATQDAFFTGTARALGSHIVYAWIFNRTALDTTANGGLQIHIGDGTNRVGYHVAGNDKTGFRHETGPVGWQCLVVDTANLPAQKTIRAGTEAGLLTNIATSITQIGTIVKGLTAAPGMSATYNADIIRIFQPATNDGCVLSIIAGTSGDPGTFAQIAAADRQIGNQQAHGVVRELASGAFGVQGPLRFGNATGTGSSWFEEKNSTIVFESRGFTTTRYKIFITDNGVGTTTFRLGTKVGTGSTATGTEGVTFTAPPGVGAEFNADSDADVTDVFIYGSSFVGFTNGVGFRSMHEFIGGRIVSSGTVRSNGVTMVNSDVISSTAAVALLWNANLDTAGRLDGCSFSSGGTGHAIELGTSTPSTITFNNIGFIGYGADGTTDAAVYNNSGKAITINIVGGAAPTVRNGAGASTNVVNAVTFTVTNIIDQSEVRIVRQSDLVILAGVETVGSSPVDLDGVTVSADPDNAGRFRVVYSYNHTADVPIFVIVFNVSFQAIYQSATLRSTNSSLLVSQIQDRQYDAGSIP
jgi:hypothetical protein